MSKTSIFGSHKVWRYPERVAAYLSGEVPMPVTMEIDMTNACTHQCPGCAGGRAANASLTLEEAEAWLRDMAEFGVKGVIFTGGGEPLCHKSTATAIVAAKQCGLQVALITNGGLIGRLSPHEFLPMVHACSWIRVSLDAADADMLEQTHGVGVEEWNAVLAGIQRLSEAARTGEHVGCTVGVGYLTNAATKRGMLRATKRAREAGADYIQFRPYHWDRTPIADTLPLCRQEETETFRVLCSEQKYSRFGEWPDRDYTRCHGCFFVGVVQADGNMPLCCHLRGVKEFYIGNLRESPLHAIWGGEQHREVARRVDVSRCVPFCRCDHLNRVLDDAKTPKTHEAFL